MLHVHGAANRTSVPRSHGVFVGVGLESTLLPIPFFVIFLESKL